jgi:polyisoprenoid-binding protein YceI
MQLRHSLPAFTVALMIATPSAYATTWDIDSKHSSASFKVRHMMVSNVRGQVGGITGTAEFDGRNVDEIKVTAKLDPATINTNDTGRDEHLKNADFFDVQKYPTIEFVSTGIVPVMGAGFKMGGKLTMHGVTKNVELSVDGPTEAIKDPKGKTRVGAAATTRVKRKDFGIVYNSTLETGGVAIGDEVDVTIEVELVKREDAADAKKDAEKAAEKADKAEAKKEKKEKKVEEKKEKKEEKKDKKPAKASSTSK